ncbi:MAG: hypothetical protein ABIM40_01800 [Pseudomonadota bacterium]
MIPRRRRYADSSSALELLTEVLQTDIQRFLALFGFLLMSVFALVQSIPVTAPNMGAKLEELVQIIADQNSRVEELTQENENLKQVVEQALSEKDLSREKEEDLKRTEKELQDLRRRLETLKNEKIRQEADASRLREKLAERDRRIERVAREQETVARRVQPEREAPKPEEKTSGKGTSKAKGGLFFASPEDVSQLLCAKAVSLYIQVKEGPSFEAQCQGGNIRFRNADVPEDLFGGWVPREQVPARVMEGFRKFTTLSSRENTVIVNFSPALAEKIRRMPMGARVLIYGDGRVESENG